MRLSLRSRLTLLAATTTAGAVIGVATASFMLAHAKLHRQFDAQLRSYTRIAATAGSAEEALDKLRPVELRRTEPGLIVQFVGRSGAVSTAGSATTIPVTAQTTDVALGRQAAPEIVRINRANYRVWTEAHGGGLVQIAWDTEEIDRTLGELGVLHVLVGLAGVLGAALLGRAVARTGLRPVDTLTAAAERVAHTHDLTERIAVDGRGELARLAEAFNAMLAALAVSRQARRRLVEDAGHELRTPLTSLRNNVELLLHAEAQARALSARDRARLLDDLGTQAAELTTLVGELVDLAKEETSPEPLSRLDLADVVEAAVERARPRAAHVTFAVALAAADVVGRPAALERAVLNLLDNAAKWSPPGGTVEVALFAESTAVITVADQGPGIAEHDVPHVFDRFYRADTARALPGSGLGLAIVAQTVAMHGGTVQVGRANGGGALLGITLPLAVDPQEKRRRS